MLYALDIETECSVTGCSGFGGSHGCDHALRPQTARISVVAIWSPEFKQTFTDEQSFVDWHLAQQSPQYIGHGFSFDIKHIAGFFGLDIFPNWYHDTLIMAHVYTKKIPDDWMESYGQRRSQLNKERREAPHRNAKRHSLKTLAPYFLDVEPFWEPVHHSNLEYALLDAEYTYRLYTYFLENLTTDEAQFAFTKVISWSKMLYQAERRGALLDRNVLDKLSAQLTNQQEQLLKELDQEWADAHGWHYEQERKACILKYTELAAKRQLTLGDSPRYSALYEKALMKLPRRIDYGSPMQMQDVLKNFFKLDIKDFSGKESSKASVLESLANQGNAQVGKYLDWRRTEKLLTSFLPKYKELQDPDGRIRSSFNVAGTRTGRLSNSDPNFQQTPSDLKHLIVAPPGYKLICRDLSAIEARLIAWYAADQTMFKIVTEGISIHDVNAIVFFDLKCDLKDVKRLFPKERQAAKTVGFALFYGAGAARIEESFLQEGFPIDREKAHKLLRAFKSKYKESFAFHRQVTEEFERGDTILNGCGRPVRIQPDENAYMQGYNTLVQSTASDLNLECLYQANQEYLSKCIEAYPILLVHDSVVIEVKEDQAEEAQAILLNKYKKKKLVNELGTIEIESEGGIYDVWH